MKYFRPAALALLALLVAWRIVIPTFGDEIFGVRSTAESVEIIDFAAHLAFAEAFWTEGAGYDVDSHVRIMNAKVGRPLDRSLPFGYSPTMLWALAPFVWVPELWAYVLWTFLGVFVFWRTVGKSPSPWPLVALFSPISLACMKLGQTAFFTSAALYFLMMREVDAADKPASNASHRILWAAVVLWALSAKPPFAVVGATALLAGGRWRIVATAVAFAALSSAALTPGLGAGWVGDYWSLISNYNLDQIPRAFASSIVPSDMGNVRALMHTVIGVADRTASQVAFALWIAATAAVFFAGATGFLSAPARWAYMILAYLLFSPHVTATEELHLLLPLALIVRNRSRTDGKTPWLAVGLVLAVLYLSPGLGVPDALRILFACLAKLLLTGVIGSSLRNEKTVESSRLADLPPGP